jgi:hypothetical protein
MAPNLLLTFRELNQITLIFVNTVGLAATATATVTVTVTVRVSIRALPAN